MAAATATPIILNRWSCVKRNANDPCHQVSLWLVELSCSLSCYIGEDSCLYHLLYYPVCQRSGDAGYCFRFRQYVCLSVCLSAQKLKACWSENDVTMYKYVLQCPIEVVWHLALTFHFERKKRPSWTRRRLQLSWGRGQFFGPRGRGPDEHLTSLIGSDTWGIHWCNFQWPWRWPIRNPDFKVIGVFRG